MSFRLPRAVFLTLLATLTVPAAAAAQSNPISAYPSPGTISASPRTQISLRGAPADRLGRIQVTGSRSGRHAGRLRSHSDRQGASFVLARPLRGGERVTVRTGLPVRGATNGDFAFRTARIPGRVTIQNRILENIDAKRTRSFRSRPDLAPPFLTVNTARPGIAPGHLFLSPKSKKDQKQAGPMIADNSGQPIWFLPLPGIDAATDFRAQTYRGKPVLTYWRGTSRQGIGVGEMLILDQSYRVIHRIRTPNGFRPDLHELVLTPRGTAVLITYPIVRADLRPVKGARRGLVVDSVIQEIDVATGLVTFEWHSLGKIALRETFSKPMPRAPFDYVHANSVNLDTDGDFLMSARNTWAIYKIDREWGNIRWRLGGKKSDFKLPAAARFAWQHDAHRRSDGAITVFDNSAFPPVRKFSRALTLRLDEGEETARLLRATAHPRRLLAATQGNQQNLPNGNFLVGWGSQRQLTEYDAAGRPLFNAFLSLGYESYRAYRMPWVGLPRSRPKVAAADEPGAGTDAYMSWNGATEVATWELFAGSSASSLRSVATVPRRGFETKITAPGAPRFVQVRARNAAGQVLSTSAPTRVTG
ncbi:MAG TPA: arylsulfotransferase family protein [Solirubrobacteraceae bacterium]|nr:arylsulfotransferase family protein [Solirubrobacteraceae bacterium]